MSSRLHTTPAQIHDAIETQIPYRFRAETVVILADLQSTAPIVRENAIVRGHAVASQLKAIAADVKTGGLFSDAEPSACSRVADFIYAHMDIAREKAPSPHPASVVNDAASAYEQMLEHDRNAWKGAQ